MYLLTFPQAVKQRVFSLDARLPDNGYVVTRLVAASTFMLHSLWAVNVYAYPNRLVCCRTQGPGTRGASSMKVLAAPRAMQPSQLGKIQGIRRKAPTSSVTSSSLPTMVRDMHVCSLALACTHSHAADSHAWAFQHTRLAEIGKFGRLQSLHALQVVRAQPGAGSEASARAARQARRDQMREAASSELYSRGRVSEQSCQQQLQQSQATDASASAQVQPFLTASKYHCCILAQHAINCVGKDV